MRNLLMAFSSIGVFLALLTLGCQGPETKPGVSSAMPVVHERALEQYSYGDLFAAGELLSRVIATPADFPTAEGEGTFGCRLDADSAQRWLPPLRALIDQRQSQEREAYVKDPVAYQRSAGFERCGPRCSCGALTAVLRGVKLKDLKSPQLRASHRESLRKLNVKSARLDPDENYACVKKAAWFCASDLRDLLEAEGPRVRLPTSASSP